MRGITIRVWETGVRRARTTVLFGLAATALTVAACASAGVNKGDFNLISYEEEWQLGAQLERDIARQMQLVNDATALNYVNAMGQRIVAQSELAQAPWEFHIVADPQINAFNIPGGHVYVFTGLICAADNAAELAGVMAHEAAHGVARHGTEQYSRAYGTNILASLLLGGNAPLYQQILTSVVANGTFAKWGRDAEREADYLGVIYMYNAGYDPMGMVTMFQELLSRQQRSPSSVEQFFSSHPLTQERIETTRAQVAQLPARANQITQDAGFPGLKSRVSAHCR
ncbi:MAG TPA: M48 family metallopeptidase [Gemmatimonadota bacterium]|nr:M48 family metallopeptidase [Gemmatimonadota bacterium]